LPPHELLDLFVSAGGWIKMRLSEPVRSRTFSKAMDKGGGLAKRRGAEVKRYRKHEPHQLVIEQSNGRKLWF
jgi:hypothetical protein